MSLNLGYYLRCEQKLSLAQKLLLKQLILSESKLRHPEYPNTIKGLEGMQTAHQILRERGSSGVLVGGLAESVWSKKRKQEDLYKHKDVDVAVLDDDFKLHKNFEGGIDWWIPREEKITIGSSISQVRGKQQRWYENGNGIVLFFGLKKDKDVQLAPGLYIPDSEWVVDMREYEVTANIDYKGVQVDLDEGVLEKFRGKVRERVRTRLPKFICETFKDYILSPHYEKDYNKISAISLEEFDLETIRGIRRLEKMI